MNEDIQDDIQDDILDDIVELIRTADIAFVEGTPEAMKELQELVEERREEYGVLRAVPRGAVPKAVSP